MHKMHEELPATHSAELGQSVWANQSCNPKWGNLGQASLALRVEMRTMVNLRGI